MLITSSEFFISMFTLQNFHFHMFSFPFTLLDHYFLWLFSNMFSSFFEHKIATLKYLTEPSSGQLEVRSHLTCVVYFFKIKDYTWLFLCVCNNIQWKLDIVGNFCSNFGFCYVPLGFCCCYSSQLIFLDSNCNFTLSSGVQPLITLFIPHSKELLLFSSLIPWRPSLWWHGDKLTIQEKRISQF